MKFRTLATITRLYPAGRDAMPVTGNGRDCDMEAGHLE